MTKKKILLMNVLVLVSLLGANNLQSQVTIGGNTEPASGAILDLNSTSRGGLLLSNVKITSLDSIPAAINADGTDVFPGLDPANLAGRDVNLPLAGMIVYNTNEALATGVGIYLWDGEKWKRTDCCCDGNPGDNISVKGASSVCNGCTTTLTGTPAGGTWVSSNNAVATVSASGVVTGIAGGTVTITYTVGSESATINVKVKPLAT
ncbi:MAG: Ig-like domain-containing protein, partial [Tannerella sp.]|nr:Ig-like domain-containing protein [Tannerella sp.]